jgi:hypothetical protein
VTQEEQFGEGWAEIGCVSGGFADLRIQRMTRERGELASKADVREIGKPLVGETVKCADRRQPGGN